MKNYTSSISRQDWSLHRKGAIDQERHKQKIREAIKKNLADIVSEESDHPLRWQESRARADSLAGGVSFSL